MQAFSCRKEAEKEIQRVVKDAVQNMTGKLVSKVNVDGGLIGGASLKAEDFSIIVKAASK